jgi:DUF1365 family protein
MLWAGYRLSEVEREASSLRLQFLGLPLFRVESPAPLSYRDRDGLGGSGPTERKLSDRIRERVFSELGFKPEGDIELITQPRMWGLSFNPVSFYLCYEVSAKESSHLRPRVEAIVAEITNTPWDERHAYVLDTRSQNLEQGTEHRFQKVFHVSPFLGMNYQYEWRFHAPTSSTFSVLMKNFSTGSERKMKLDFLARLDLEAHRWSSRSLIRACLRTPWMPAMSLFWIYWNALKLYLKRVPIFTHPKKSVGDQP